MEWTDLAGEKELRESKRCKMFVLSPLSPLGPRVGLRHRPVLRQRLRIAMDVGPGRTVSATLGEIHFPAARGEKCSLRVIHLLCSEVVNRRAARITAWSGAQLSGLPAGPGRLGKSAVICFLCATAGRTPGCGPTGWDPQWSHTHTFENQKLGSRIDHDSPSSSFSPLQGSKRKMAVLLRVPEALPFMPSLN